MPKTLPRIARRSLLLYAALAALLLTACSLVVTADENELGAQPLACEAGATSYGCLCSDNVQGIQVCNTEGSFDPQCYYVASGVAGWGGACR